MHIDRGTEHTLGWGMKAYGWGQRIATRTGVEPSSGMDRYITTTRTKQVMSISPRPSLARALK